MTVLLLALLIGVVAGPRAMTASAATSRKAPQRFGGRGRSVTMFGNDRPAARIEDRFAIIGACLVVSAAA